MDTVTHTLFGLALYGVVDKRDFSKNEKRALLFTTVVGSQIPDIDVVSQLWDTQGQYQMWHRGVTHSIFMVPVFSFLIYMFTRWKWGVRSRLYLWLGMLAVFIHSTSDLFNAWGTGYLEPISQMRITFGTVPIVDFVIWGILLIGFLVARRSNTNRKHHIYRYSWLLIVLHIFSQTVQGYLIYDQYADQYEQGALSASFVPTHFSFIGKKDNEISIYESSLFRQDHLEVRLESQEEADLDKLFAQKPEAATLYEWAPFVVVVDEEEEGVLGIYDPRFYRDGQSFLFEYIEREVEGGEG
ncbi:MULTISPECIES: metal-dependent hydrolase [Bacillaceae]|uniref:Metal-dependent hydrolase n=1 Tax=Evansella alkalicola TaxID=745819 RepID=A0ABS6JYW2_9BACI|nr:MULTISPECIES: metal-dependent hydrolase [Bacillaceae]MBU9723782.1 metal-dependent hydrolase [Bacillus alkalicola]